MSRQKTLKDGLNPVKLIIYKSSIVKVFEEDEFKYFGYDIISEMPKYIKKDSAAIELPEVVVTLLGCEESRLKLANAISVGVLKEMAEKLDTSERNVFRLMNKYDFFTDEAKAKNKMINSKKKNVMKDPLMV